MQELGEASPSSPSSSTAVPGLCLRFPYVCLEPVLVKRSHLYISGFKRPFSHHHRPPPPLLPFQQAKRARKEGRRSTPTTPLLEKQKQQQKGQRQRVVAKLGAAGCCPTLSSWRVIWRRWGLIRARLSRASTVSHSHPYY
jgi:hypothetical protein